MNLENEAIWDEFNEMVEDSTDLNLDMFDETSFEHDNDLDHTSTRFQ